LICNVVNLDLAVRLDDFLQVIFEQIVIEEVEVAPDYHVIKQLSLVDGRALLEGKQILLLVRECHFLHCLHMTALVLQRDCRVDQGKRVLALSVHDL